MKVEEVVIGLIRQDQFHIESGLLYSCSSLNMKDPICPSVERRVCPNVERISASGSTSRLSADHTTT